jgi:predicted nucleic acid-binding protein
MTVFLDTGVLGFLTSSSSSAEPMECKEWLTTILSSGVQVRVPEIADYELRRELKRIKSTKSIERLDTLGQVVGYVSISTPMMRRAAEFWSQARQSGVPTADDKALDADMILAAQVVASTDNDEPIVVATTNVKHLERFVSARVWRDITPNQTS